MAFKLTISRALPADQMNSWKDENELPAMVALSDGHVVVALKSQKDI
jgi:hypothetical protein